MKIGLRAFSSKRYLARALLASTMLFACAGVKKTAKDVGRKLDMREEVVGQPVDEEGNPVKKTKPPEPAPAPAPAPAK